jgi:hypothetical protein
VISVAVPVIRIVPAEWIVPGQIPRVNHYIYYICRAVELPEAGLVAVFVIYNDVCGFRIVFNIHDVFISHEDRVLVGGENVAVGGQGSNCPCLKLLDILGSLIDFLGCAGNCIGGGVVDAVCVSSVAVCRVTACSA